MQSSISDENSNFFSIGASLASSDSDRWFQVDFLKWTKISSSKTQGHADDDYWVKRFTLHYCTNGIDFTVYKERGIVKVWREIILLFFQRSYTGLAVCVFVLFMLNYVGSTTRLVYHAAGIISAIIQVLNMLR